MFPKVAAKAASFFYNYTTVIRGCKHFIFISARLTFVISWGFCAALAGLIIRHSLHLYDIFIKGHELTKW